MNIREEDLAEVRAVLAQQASRPEAVLDLSCAQAALLLATVLLAADKGFFIGRDFSNVLEQLVIDPGMPKAGWPRGEEPAGFHDRRRRILTASRRLGLHKSAAGFDTTLLHVPALKALLEVPGVHAQARAWYERYMSVRQNEQGTPAMAHPAADTTVQRRRMLQDEIRRHPLLGPILPCYDEHTLQRVYDELGPMLAKYFPQV